MVSEKKLASVVGGKTARACDSCISKRARWYCAADDAFLCQGCDTTVHSANSLARRHERVRLKTASLNKLSAEPSWHRGFKRKARTPRHGKHHPRTKSESGNGKQRNPIHLVPEMDPDENSFEENEEQEQLLYRVPVFDPFDAELCPSGASNQEVTNDHHDHNDDDECKLSDMLNDSEGSKDVNSMQGLYASNMDLDEFANDVENLLGKGFGDQESFDIETLGFLDCKEKDSVESSTRSTTGTTTVKLEEEEDTVMGSGEIDITRETFELNFDDYDFPANCDEDDHKVGIGGANVEKEECDELENGKQLKKKKKILLALDYEGVIAAWPDQKSPWTSGDRPELDSDDCWPYCVGDCGRVHYPLYGEMRGSSTGMFPGGREARVSRYREKRRTRLFSKKIRYEVRKLNAEKRPRMKGRFVKRTS